MSFPLDIKRKYPGYAHYILEIGSGWGEFAIALAKKQPDHLILALEKKKKRVLRAEKRQKSESIQNIKWMILDVSWFFDGVFGQDSFERVIINFPDPWPKKRHRKHRLMNEGLVKSLTRITSKKAMLEFASDSWSYMEESLRTLENSASWKNKNGRGVVLKEVPGRIESFYEILQKKDGKNAYYLEFEKIG